jgi:DNA-binding CsgD family transcriptional regulator
MTWQNHRRYDVPLSDREFEVVFAMAHGDTNKQIGAALGITWKTVASHITHIGKKIGTPEARTRAGIVGWAYRTGVLVADMEGEEAA